VGGRELQVLCEAAGVKGRRKDADDSSVCVDEKYRSRMVHRVVAAGKVHSQGHHFKGSQHLLEGFRIPGEANELGVKGMRILSHQRRGVSLGVHGHKQHLQAGNCGRIFYLRELGERGRADIGAVRESEEYEAGSALELAGREGVALVVGQLEIRHLPGQRQPRSACKLRGRAVKFSRQPETGQRSA